MLYPLMLLYLMLLYVIWHGIILTIFDHRGSIILSLHRCNYDSHALPTTATSDLRRGLSLQRSATHVCPSVH